MGELFEALRASSDWQETGDGINHASVVPSQALATTRRLSRPGTASSTLLEGGPFEGLASHAYTLTDPLADDTDPAAHAELSVFCVGAASAVHRKVRAVFPEAPARAASFLACLTMQSVLSQAPPERGMEEALRRVRAWTGGLRAALGPLGYWADAVDPRTGTPLFGEASGEAWAEARAVGELLREYPILDLGPCPFVLHPTLGAWCEEGEEVANVPLGSEGTTCTLERKAFHRYSSFTP